MSESTNPGVISPFVAAESGKSNVSVNVSSPTVHADPGGGAKGNFVRDNWAIIAFMIGAVFSAGILWNKVDQLEDRQARLRADMNTGFKSVSDKLDTMTFFSFTPPASKPNDF